MLVGIPDRSAWTQRREHCVRSNMVHVLGMRYSAYECTKELTGMDVTTLVIAIIGAATGVAGVVTAVISIRIVRRTATAGDVTAIATKTATEVAQQQLAIERDRHHHELEQRREDAAPALAGHVVKNDGDDGDGHARLEIHVMNSVRLTTVTIILPASRTGQPARPLVDDGAVGPVSGDWQRPDRGWPSRSLERRPGRETATIRCPGYSPCRLRDEVGPASGQGRLRRLTGRLA